MPKRKGVYFTGEEVGALWTELATVYHSINEELMSGVYDFDTDHHSLAVGLRDKLKRVLEVPNG